MMTALSFTKENRKSSKPSSDAPVVGSGNFLADRGYADPDETRLKFLLSNEIALLFGRMEVSQTKFAELVELSQADVSRIINGNVKDYSVWRLMKVLNILGKDILVEVSNSPEPRGQTFTNFIEPEPDAGPDAEPGPSF
jgi:predicted XRE-type DNA-binding protein